MILIKKVKKVQDVNDQSFGIMVVEEVVLDKFRNGRLVIGVLVKNDNQNSLIKNFGLYGRVRLVFYMFVFMLEVWLQGENGIGVFIYFVFF